MKILPLFSLSLLTFALTACSGGGGGNDSPKENKPTPPAVPAATPAPAVTEKKPEAETEAKPKSIPEKPKVTGTVVKNQEFIPLTTEGNSLDFIEVWHKKIPLLDPLAKQEIKNGWKTLQPNETGTEKNIISDFLTYARIGSIRYHNENYEFAHGFATENLPAHGVAHYEGKHLVTFRNEEEHRKDPTKPIQLLTIYGGAAHFDVNFDDKRLTGSLQDIDGASVPFTAEIKENSFASDFFDKLKVEGKFYGPNAEELAGTYQEKHNDRFSGAFGAKKVEKPKP